MEYEYQQSKEPHTRIPGQIARKVKRSIKFIDPAEVKARATLFRSRNLLQMRTSVRFFSCIERTWTMSNTM